MQPNRSNYDIHTTFHGSAFIHTVERKAADIHGLTLRQPKIKSMSCGCRWAEEFCPPPLCGAVISPPEFKNTQRKVSPRIYAAFRSTVLCLPCLVASFKLLCDTITMQKICVGVGPCRTGTLYALYYCALIINVGISGVNHSSTLTMLAATRQQFS